MKPAALQDLADDLADAAERIAHDVSEGSRRLREAMRGQPRAATLDGLAGGSGGHSDPTAAAGLSDDPARADEAALGRELKTAHRHARHVVDILDRYAPRSATSIERKAVARANDPTCWSCARIEDRKGIPVVQEPHTKTPTTVNGNLAEPRFLCRWCYDFVRLTGRLPYRREVRAHIAGEKVFVPERKGSNRVRM